MYCLCVRAPFYCNCGRQIVLVRGHGALVMGETLEEAVYYARKLQEACVAQLGLGRAAAACAMEEEAARAIFEHEMALSRDVIRGLTQSDAPEHWRLGEFEFENYMRYLDEAGYRTGHVFRLPVSRLEQPRERRFDEGIEIPPTTSTLTYYSCATSFVRSIVTDQNIYFSTLTSTYLFFVSFTAQVYMYTLQYVAVLYSRL